MCGIVGVVGKLNACKSALNVLKNLEYRGYDSAGLAFLKKNQLNTIKALANGEINSFLGFNFITSNRLSIASSKRLCLAFAMDGIKLALGQDIMTRIDERSDKGYATQVYVCMTMGATRMEEEKVVTVEAHEA